jgi:3-oxosteroid 1-dehydrogenase
MAAGLQYDLIVLGTGIAGLATALAAHEQGLRPIVLEKSDKVGGGTTNSYGLIWVGDNHLARAAGFADSRDDVISYMRFLAGGEEYEPNLLTFVDRSPEVLKKFEEYGIRFQLTRGLADHYFGVAPTACAEGRSLEATLISGRELGEWQSRARKPGNLPVYLTCEEQIAWGGLNRYSHWDKDTVRQREAQDMRGKGAGLICHFLKALLARGVPISLEDEVERLRVEDGRVVGVSTKAGREITAQRGVVIATGGYESNPQMVQNFEGLPNWLSQCPPSNTGDGLMLASEVGAAVRLIRNNMQLFLSIALPSAPNSDEPNFHLAGIIELCSPHTIVVNEAGRRFADESYFQGMVPALRHFDPASHRWSNLPCFLVFDQNYADAYSFAGQPAGAPIPDWVARDSDIGSLAIKLGVDAAGLKQTHERFNGFARSGTDVDFHRGELAWRLAQDSARKSGPNQSLGALDRPPFYGVELRPSAGGSAGILTNEHGQVMHHRGQPVAGLYAIGNAAARTEFGAGYQAGLTLASGMTFGYIAAEHMAGNR